MVQATYEQVKAALREASESSTLSKFIGYTEDQARIIKINNIITQDSKVMCVVIMSVPAVSSVRLCPVTSLVTLTPVSLTLVLALPSMTTS